jgi:putative membrane protein
MGFGFQSPELDAWASGFPLMLAHVGVTLAILAAAAALYALLSPHREIQLIREGNPAAALSFGGVLAGLALPLAFALAASTSTLEIALWGVTTAIVQLFLFWLSDLVFYGLPQRVREGDVAAAALVTAARLAVAAILAAAVTA